MPRLAQLLAEGLPLTHFLRIVRGIVLKGASFAEVSRELVWLAAIFAALVAVASVRFRKKLG
jgi:ABC-2 type transport system permease protein